MRILLIRTSALGDVVHALPVLSALRRQYPEARIGWVVERSIAPLLHGHADLDEVFEVDLRGWRRRALAATTRRELRSAIGRLRAFDPDVTLELMGNHKGGALARLAGGGIRIGARRTDRREPSSAVWLDRAVPLRGTHAVERTLSILDGLGLPAAEVDFGADKLLPRPAPEAAAWVASRTRPFVYLHAGAAWGNKRYPAGAWAAVAHDLAAETHHDVVVGVAPGEESLAAEIVAGGRGAVEAVAAPTLAHLATLLRGATLVLGGDTGPLHLARALGVPTVFVMGPTDPARHGPFGDRAGAVALALPCSGCYRRFDDAKACLLGLPPRLVVETALQRLGGRAAG